MKTQLDKQLIAELIKEPGAGEIFIGKLEECKANQLEHDKQVKWHEEWVKSAEGIANNKALAFLREEVLNIKQSELDKEKRKWKELLRQHLGLQRPESDVLFRDDYDLTNIKEVPLEELTELQKLRIGTTRSQALCPFHEERTPSFTIYHESNTYHCFGCGENGDNINFVKKLYGVQFKEAINIITQYGINS